jgi:hypothetical protein
MSVLSSDDGKSRAARAARIAALNDAFRQSFQGGKVMMTASVAALPLDIRVMALRAVRTFSAFNADNDPHAEHDFGSFKIAGESFFWKIDYYDPSLTFGSDDPADAAKTRRVLTLMLAEDY